MWELTKVEVVETQRQAVRMLHGNLSPRSLLLLLWIAHGMQVTRSLPARAAISVAKRFSITSTSSSFLQASTFVDSLKEITSDQNPAYKFCKLLYNKKSKRKQERLMILESHRTIIDGIKAGLVPTAIFATSSSLKAPLAGVLEEAITHNQLYDITYHTKESLVRKLSDVENSQGVVGIFEMKERMTKLPARVSAMLVCDGISDPGNLGTLIRTAWGLEFDACVTIASTDPFSPKCIRSSMGSSLYLPIMEVSDWMELEEEISKQGLQIYLSVLDDQATPYYDADLCKPCMIVVGSESTGISKQTLEYTKHSNSAKIFIPMGSNLDMSLNAAVAGGIIMGECKRQRSITTT